MEIRQVRYLVTAIHCGSLGKAALELGLATSALSQQITRLEGELSTRLLVRGASGVTPTEAGAAFCQHATLAMRHIEAAVAAAQGARATGVVSLGLAPTTSSILALPLIQVMARRYPNIRLQLVEGMSGHLSNMLKGRQIDLAILFDAESVAFARGEAIPLLDERLFVIGKGPETDVGVPNVEAFPEVDLATASSLPLIMPSKGHGLRSSLDRSFAAANVTPNIIMEIDSLSVIMEAVEAKLGYTIQPGAALARTSSAGLNVRRISDPGAHIIRENGFSDRLDRVAFVGFSQGTIIVVDAVASCRWPIGAVVGFSGRLAATASTALCTLVLLIHGSADEVISATESTSAAATLEALARRRRGSDSSWPASCDFHRRGRQGRQLSRSIVVAASALTVDIDVH